MSALADLDWPALLHKSNKSSGKGANAVGQCLLATRSAQRIDQQPLHRRFYRLLWRQTLRPQPPFG